MNNTYVFLFGITMMLLSFASGFTIGKIIVFLPIGWWLYFIFLSKKPEHKNLKVRVALGIMLFISIIEAYMI